MTSGFDASAEPAAAAPRSESAEPVVPTEAAAPTEPAAQGAGWQRHLTVLAELDGRPLGEHVEIYQSLHAELQAALADIDGA